MFAINDETKQNMEEKHTEDGIGANNLIGFHSSNGNGNSFMAYSFNNAETGGEVSNEKGKRGDSNNDDLYHEKDFDDPSSLQ